VSRSEEAGVHQVQWDGRDDAGHGVARGVYFARLRLGPETLHRTLVLIQ
jgi:flagellar hook assembly protein FlgD